MSSASEPRAAEPSAAEQASPSEPTTALDPIDQEWLRRRSAAGPLAFGVIGLVTSPLLLGLAFGALGMRAGVDLWRHGTRRPVVAVGIGASFAAVVTSVIGALLWGSVLTTVLLGRDAMRETERWRGRTVEAVQVRAVGIPFDVTAPELFTDERPGRWGWVKAADSWLARTESVSVGSAVSSMITTGTPSSLASIAQRFLVFRGP
jgi:hypothetical protein